MRDSEGKTDSKDSSLGKKEISVATGDADGEEKTTNFTKGWSPDTRHKESLQETRKDYSLKDQCW